MLNFFSFRDEIWDKLPKDNRQVTFLVFRYDLN